MQDRMYYKDELIVITIISSFISVKDLLITLKIHVWKLWLNKVV
jgi:hypothetical protein